MIFLEHFAIIHLPLYIHSLIMWVPSQFSLRVSPLKTDIPVFLGVKKVEMTLGSAGFGSQPCALALNRALGGGVSCQSDFQSLGQL